jgi:hypothetical protein
MEPLAHVASVAHFLGHDHESEPYGFGPDATLALLLDFRRLGSGAAVIQPA